MGMIGLIALIIGSSIVIPPLTNYLLGLTNATVKNKEMMQAQSVAYSDWQEVLASNYNTVPSISRHNVNDKYDLQRQVSSEQAVSGGGYAKPVVITVYHKDTDNVAYSLNAEKSKPSLNEYYTKAEVEDFVNNKLSNYFTKSEINNKFGNYYNKSEIDSKFGNYYTKPEINYLFGEYYQKSEIDSLLNDLKANQNASFTGNCSSSFRVPYDALVTFTRIGISACSGNPRAGIVCSVSLPTINGSSVKTTSVFVHAGDVIHYMTYRDEYGPGSDVNSSNPALLTYMGIRQ